MLANFLWCTLLLCCSASFAQTAANCARVTEAVQRRYQKLPRFTLQPIAGDPKSCTYLYTDNDQAQHRPNYTPGTLVVTLYGDRGKPLSSYIRPGALSDYRTIIGLGQLAAFGQFYYKPPAEKNHGFFTLYRNNRCVLDVLYQNWELTNKDYDGIRQIVDGILGLYTAPDAPLSEPTAPPK